MKGVMRASVSAGSSHRDASVTWSPQVIVPSGAAWSGTVHPRRRRARMASARAMDELLAPVADRPGRLMGVILSGEGGYFFPWWAMMSSLILSYVTFGTMFLLTSSSFRLYGRFSTIFLA